MLPKGIANIRPHLRDVDNVPLLVSLFTDCCTNATLQMISIMQENMEVRELYMGFVFCKVVRVSASKRF